MVLYLCERCGYSKQNRQVFRNHLNRKYTCHPILSEVSIEEIKCKYVMNEKMNSNEHKMNTNEHKMNTNEHK